MTGHGRQNFLATASGEAVSGIAIVGPSLTQLSEEDEWQLTSCPERARPRSWSGLSYCLVVTTECIKIFRVLSVLAPCITMYYLCLRFHCLSPVWVAPALKEAANWVQGVGIKKQVLSSLSDRSRRCTTLQHEKSVTMSTSLLLLSMKSSLCELSLWEAWLRENSNLRDYNLKL